MEAEECPESSGRNKSRGEISRRRKRRRRNSVENRRIAIRNGNVRRRRDRAGTEVDERGESREYHRNGF